MQEAGIDCEIIPSPADEIHDATLTPQALTEHNAQAKAQVISESNPEATVIGADTLVFIDGEPLGKPRDMALITKCTTCGSLIIVSNAGHAITAASCENGDLSVK